MQTEYLLAPRYYQVKQARVSLADAKAHMRFDALRRFEIAMKRGLSSREAACVVGIPVSTLFRWRARQTRQVTSLMNRSRRPHRLRRGADRSLLRRRIVQLRQEHPTWGKRKITRLLVREGEVVKESTVGRVISALINKGSIPSAKQAASRAGKRIRPKRPHARFLKRGQRLRSDVPGDAVQIDHMSVEVKPGCLFKHFNAVCTTSRWNVAAVYKSATAKNASRFVEQIVDDMPFPISRIQIDGGSEFMADFEIACKNNNIELFVLAPKSPKLNGHVERINGTWRSEFYDLYDLPIYLDELRKHVQNYNDTYNWDRPHDSLNLQTPEEFLEARGIQVAAA